MGGCEGAAPAALEPTLKYHPEYVLVLTPIPVNPGGGHCQLGSLTGAVSSKRVTEEPNGTLSLVGNQALSAKVEECLTARLISRAETKVGLSDPAVLDGKAVARSTVSSTTSTAPRPQTWGRRAGPQWAASGVTLA